MLSCYHTDRVCRAIAEKRRLIRRSLMKIIVLKRPFEGILRDFPLAAIEVIGVAFEFVILDTWIFSQNGKDSQITPITLQQTICDERC